MALLVRCDNCGKTSETTPCSDAVASYEHAPEGWRPNVIEKDPRFRFGLVTCDECNDAVKSATEAALNACKQSPSP